MITRKIIIYPKSAMKPIIMTDVSDDALEDIEKSILDVMQGDKISVLNTQNDRLVVRPSEIQAVLISKKETDTHGKSTKYSEVLNDSSIT